MGNALQLSTTVPTVGGGTQTDNQSFCYDALSRLIWAGNSGTPSGGDHCGNAPSGTTLSAYQQSFSYDDLDRLTSGPAGTITYGDTNHVHAATTLSSIPNQYAAYDAMGNMVCRNTDPTTAHTCADGSPTGALMSYDVEGRLTSWTAPSGTTATDSFLYDGEGNRVLQETNTSSITDTITFDDYTETVITGGTPTTTKFYSANGQRVAMRTSSTLSYLLSDALGSSTVALDSTGATQAVQLFAPYGAVRYSQGTMPTTYNFTGQRLDSQTGLLYYNARYYDPLSGRFTQADMIETNASGKDPYAYVGDNPETFNDPTGHGFDPRCLLDWGYCFPAGSPIYCFYLRNCATESLGGQVQVPAPPQASGKAALVVAAIIALALLIAHFALSSPKDIDKNNRWKLSRQNKIASDLANEVDDARVADQGGDSRSWGSGYLEVVRSGKVAAEKQLGITKGSDNYNPEIDNGAINGTHTEKLTLNNAAEWIRQHYNELQAGDVISIMVYTEVKPCEFCGPSFQEWAEWLRDLAPNGVTVILYVYFRPFASTKNPWLSLGRPIRRDPGSPYIAAPVSAKDW